MGHWKMKPSLLAIALAACALTFSEDVVTSLNMETGAMMNARQLLVAEEVVSLNEEASTTGNDYWIRTSNAALSGHNNAKASGSLDACKEACIARASCKSSDFKKSTKKCDLSDSAAGKCGVPALKTNYAGNPYDHYALHRGNVFQKT